LRGQVTALECDREAVAAGLLVEDDRGERAGPWADPNQRLPIRRSDPAQDAQETCARPRVVVTGDRNFLATPEEVQDGVDAWPEFKWGDQIGDVALPFQAQIVVVPPAASPTHRTDKVEIVDGADADRRCMRWIPVVLQAVRLERGHALRCGRRGRQDLPHLDV